MSVFDYPRINIKGTVQVNPGTANNDDYAGDLYLPDTDETLGLLVSQTVEPRTYGKTDEEFVPWVQKKQTFAKKSSGKTVKQIPAEWNYYGDMSMNYKATVVGVQTGVKKKYAERTRGVPLTDLIRQEMTFSGCMTDINPEGSPPATQFFIGQINTPSGAPLVKGGVATKGVGQLFNFLRNANLVQDAGSGTYVYHVIRGHVDLPGFENASGVVFRYYLYRAIADNPHADIEKLYENHETNLKTLEFVGTFAPLHDDEQITAAPTGRLMVSNKQNIEVIDKGKKNTNNNGGGLLALGPAVVHYDSEKQIVSGDFSGSFPEFFRDRTNNNKYDFGPVSLNILSGRNKALIGPVDYAKMNAGAATEEGNVTGWMFDFDVSDNAIAQAFLASPDATLALIRENGDSVLQETEFYIVSNQQAVYGEQHGSHTEFLNQGAPEPMTVSVFHRGHELAPDACPSINLWWYRSTPLQSPGNVEGPRDLKPHHPIEVDVSQPGNLLFTFTIEGDGQPVPPPSYGTFAYPPAIDVLNAPAISLRILPNDKDFSEYYRNDPSDKEPVGNDKLTFQVVYENVLRTYYLLYPVMSEPSQGGFPLNVEPDAQQAAAILQRTEPNDPALWLSCGYMPKTRDLSASRRTLLRAWCHKKIGA